MSIDKPSKLICEFCGGAHSTSEHKDEEKESLQQIKKGTTNVAPEQLNYGSYESEVYDEDIRRSIPGYDELHTRIEDVVKEHINHHKVDRILELGSGTGLTSERLLKLMSGASLTAVDFSQQMMKGARNRLADSKVNFIVGDYSEIELGKEYGVVVSVIGIHHQTHEGKRKLFRKIFDSLKPGGIFIFGDLVTYRDEKKAAVNDEKHYQHLRENARNEQSLQEWEHHHKFQNLYAPIEDQIEWLKEVGFSRVDVAFEHIKTALIIAQK